MKKFVSALVAVLAVGVFLTGCGQEKVIDTDFIRLQNKVKDIDNLQKQKVDQQTQLAQKVADIEQTVKQQKDQIASLMKLTKDASGNGTHPVVIQDVKISSEKMDSDGRLWGPFNLNVTLYNGTDNDISDHISTFIMTDNPSDTTDAPKVQNLDQKFDIKAKESTTVTFSNISVGQPTVRMNLIVKLMEDSESASTIGVPGKVTWVEVPTVIYPPK